MTPHLVGARRARGVGLHDEEGAGIPVQAHRAEVLDGVDRRAVHELDHRGAHGAAELDDGGGGGGDGGEGGHDGRARLLGRDEAQDRPGDDAQGALGADEELEQRQAGDVLDPLAPERDQRAVGEDDVEPEDVVGRHPVLHAAQAAGVRRDVAADGADLVRARVRRVPEAVLGRGPLDLDVEGSRLDDGDPGGDVDLDRAHPLGRQDDAAVDGERPARQPGAGAARDHRDAVPARPAHRLLHVGGGLRADGRDRHPRRGVVGPVEAVLLERVGCGDDDTVGQHPHELGDSIGPSPNPPRVGCPRGRPGSHLSTQPEVRSELGAQMVAPADHLSTRRRACGEPPRADAPPEQTPGVGRTWQEVAESQAGVLSEATLRELGVRRAFVRNQLRAGRWAERTHSVYSTTTGPLSREQLLWVALRARRPGCPARRPDRGRAARAEELAT